MAEQGSRKPAKVAKKTIAKTGVVKATMPRKTAPRKASRAVLLSGGNPQIAKGYGDAPVQAYITAMPGWKREPWANVSTS